MIEDIDRVAAFLRFEQEQSRPCSGCGYPLTGNETETNCPVCVPIARMRQASADRKAKHWIAWSQPKDT